MALHILGIRHHGPGSSKHLIKALEELQPDIVLIEGPPEGEAIISWVSHENMKAPVAMLVYVPDYPQQAVFYPFSDYSPEWNAIKYAQNKKIPVRFIDMPLANKMTEKKEAADQENLDLKVPQLIKQFEIRKNPISYLSDIAGYEDSEEWWEHQFELAKQPTEVFEAIAKAMTTLREQLSPENNVEEEIREAFMRRAIRNAQREMYHTIAVVCGAWHVPALQNMPSQKHDDNLIKNLPKTKVDATWIPWTNDRLSYDSGYGAGINSPGWYHHCWQKNDEQGIEWLTHTAHIFRKHQIEISSAHVIETVRLANTLAMLRNYSKPGLKELNEASQTVMCMGDSILMRIIWKDLIVGNLIGEIPEGTPQVPLMNDFEKQIKSLRLKLSADDKLLKLDLRESNDLQKSILLHRLNTMDITWGTIQHVSSKGTFKEEWTLCWSPELNISLIEKAPWGNTIEMACNKYMVHLAADCFHLGEISSYVQKALPSELQEGIFALMKKMDELSASSNDTLELMDTIIPLAQISRYGNVRKTDFDTIQFILSSVFYRMIIGLPLSATGIDEEQAIELTNKIKEIQSIVLLLDNAEFKESWLTTIATMSENLNIAPMVQGHCNKILYDTKFVEIFVTSTAFSKALSINQDPNYSVNWLEGFLKESGNLLILDANIWNIVFEWVATIQVETFKEIVPLLRRTFAEFNTVEKVKIAEKVKLGKSVDLKQSTLNEIDIERGKLVFPIIEKLLNL